MSITSKVASAAKRYRREATLMTLLITAVSVMKIQEFSLLTLIAIPVVYLTSAIFFAAMIPLMEDIDKTKRQNNPDKEDS